MAVWAGLNDIPEGRERLEAELASRKAQLAWAYGRRNIRPLNREEQEKLDRANAAIAAVEAKLAALEKKP